MLHGTVKKKKRKKDRKCDKRKKERFMKEEAKALTEC